MNTVTPINKDEEIVRALLLLNKEKIHHKVVDTALLKEKCSFIISLLVGIITNFEEKKCSNMIHLLNEKSNFHIEVIKSFFKEEFDNDTLFRLMNNNRKETLCTLQKILNDL